MSKNIVIILKRPPHGSLFPAEGLRVAVAVSASEAKVVCIEDGVYAFLKDTDMTLYKHHLEFMTGCEIPVLIDKNSLDKRGLTKSDLIEGVTVTEHTQIIEELASADATLTF